MTHFPPWWIEFLRHHAALGEAFYTVRDNMFGYRHTFYSGAWRV